MPASPGRTRWIAAILVLLPAAVAQADGYREPAGFNGYAWQTPLNAFGSLSLWRANTALNSRGKVSYLRIECRAGSGGNTCPAGTAQVFEQAEGAGSFALGEYYREWD